MNKKENRQMKMQNQLILQNEKLFDALQRKNDALRVIKEADIVIDTCQAFLSGVDFIKENTPAPGEPDDGVGGGSESE